MATQYLLATLIPGDVGRAISKIQHRFRVPTWTSHLPPHITLVPPFRLKESGEQAFVESVSEVEGQHQPFLIHIDGIDRFDNETVTLYARVKNTIMLDFLHKFLLNKARTYAQEDPMSFPSYTPHVTLSDKLTMKEAAVQLREMESCQYTFQCEGFTLFRRLDNGDWEEVIWVSFV